MMSSCIIISLIVSVSGTYHALSDSSLLSKIHSLADADVSHKKLFVHGLSWDTTKEDLLKSFSQFGEIEECNLVTDRVTKKAKGYAFVIFKSCVSTSKALRNPRMKIKNRDVSFQLASMGPPGSGMSSGGGNGGSSVSERKIYVSNVGVDVNVEKLRAFFEKFEHKNGSGGIYWDHDCNNAHSLPLAGTSAASTVSSGYAEYEAVKSNVNAAAAAAAMGLLNNEIGSGSPYGAYGGLMGGLGLIHLYCMDCNMYIQLSKIKKMHHQLHPRKMEPSDNSDGLIDTSEELYLLAGMWPCF
ncbi:hypothetical protein Leryth_024715 [Lithospermum erythrorhizon]|nr:hypothetical protein Leryth_024715 [Lithospermum erythrorhizon]